MYAQIASRATPILKRATSRFTASSPWICAPCALRSNVKSRYFATQPPAKKPYYITTPIFYVNAAPHVGHLYTMVLADVHKRWKLLHGEKALLCTGTDEHGLKIQRAAAMAGIDPKTFCDKGAENFKELAKKAEITYDHFVRTTDSEHQDAVQYAWFLLQEKGLIYEQKHEGWYSVSDECFYPQSGVRPWIDPVTGKKTMTSIETGSEVEWSSEENYHFRLSAFRDQLLKFYEENPEWITPKQRMESVVAAVKSGLDDLSISRPYDRLSWGIRVPGDDTQTIYVWLDALLNYATKAGYPWTPGHEHAGGWPADCHVIGKDIIRFHCIYWPAFLMALGLPLPKKILTHAHWTLNGKKMSKSTGRVVDPFHALDRFGIDVMRFYLVSNGGTVDDGNYDNARIVNMYYTFLTQKLGNLASRVIRGKKWSVRGAIQRIGPKPKEYWEEGSGSKFYKNSLSEFAADMDLASETYDPRKATLLITEFVRGSNQFFQMSSPWGKILNFAPGEPGEEVDRIIYLAAESLRLIGIVLQAYMPNKAKELLDQLGVQPEKRNFKYCHPGADLDYGKPMMDVGVGLKGVLFPTLPFD